MYGYINLILKSFILERFGKDAWRKVIGQSKCSSDYELHLVYDDGATKKLIDTSCLVIGLERAAFLRVLGEYYLEYLRRSGHHQLLRNLGDTLPAFLDNLDYLHTVMMSDYPDINMPSFRTEPDVTADVITLHYYSFREGYHPMVEGLLMACAKHFYQKKLKIHLVSKDMEVVANKKGRREHVIYAIEISKIEGVAGDGPPTFIAQTKKHAEKQILKQDIDHVTERLEQIRREHGEEALPLNKSKAVRAKWRSLAKVTVMFGGFIPAYPQRLALNPASFCHAFPYHVAFDSDMNVLHAGVKIQEMMPSIRTPEVKVQFFFELLHPHSVDFNFDNVQKFINTPFVLKTKASKMEKSWGQKPMVILRGQMVRMDEHPSVIYLCSPFVRKLPDLEARNMFLSDIPIHDVTRDMIVTASHIRANGLGHQPKQHVNDRRVSPILVRSAPDVDHDDDVQSLRDKLRRTRLALEEERQKNEVLYRGFLPTSIARQVAHGQQPEAGEFRHVTVLFCDVVAFSQIVSRCKPNDVVNLLTQLHTRFNRICAVHSTYRVETIGDAYMVVAGVPEAIITHAERVANTGLGMLLVAREVLSPFDYGDHTSEVKIRLGIHTGTVVCGVVGDRLPRFMVFGDAVNVASRMESHGVPGRIHISQTTYQSVQNKGYRIEKRGIIEVRGHGNMATYFLLSNENVSDDDLVGRVRRTNGVEVTFINEGRHEYPPETSSSTSLRSPPAGLRKDMIQDDVVRMMYSDTPRQKDTPKTGDRSSGRSRRK